MAKFIVEIREDMNDMYACGVSNPSVEDLSLFIRVGAGECDGFIPYEALTVERVE
jgi:hypothetical protein